MKCPTLVQKTLAVAACLTALSLRADPETEADLIIVNGKVLTVDSKFSTSHALAVKGDKILAVGTDKEMNEYKGALTRVIDANGRTVMPGIYDSHVHSYYASVSEIEEPLPSLSSLAEAFDYIQKQAAEKTNGSWIILQRVYPTRMKEGRLPTLKELDDAAPNNPVYWNCGPVSMVNSMALEVSKISSTTTNPPGGEIVKDKKKNKPTGLLRNAASVLKLPPTKEITAQQHLDALKQLYHLYNQQGITSIGERRAEKEAIDAFRDLSTAGELTVRINCTRVITPTKSLDDSIVLLDSITNMPAGKGPYGPTGAGDDWVRIGPLKTFLDGGILVGTAYMRTPWGIGPTYQITEPAYRGQLLVDPEVLPDLYLEAARRGWQLTAHCTGDAALDEILNTYEYVNFKTNITKRRFLITHADFQTDQDWSRCRKLGICADMQPIWLYKDGDSLMKTLGKARMKWFLSFKTWFDSGLTIGGGSDHMVKLDSFDSTNPWNPWFGMWIALTRQTENTEVLNPKECLSREQAIRFYTINNAYLNFEESKKGSLETGKFADLVLLDRDIMKCPVNEVKDTRVLLTLVGGKIVWELQ